LSQIKERFPLKDEMEIKFYPLKIMSIAHANEKYYEDLMAMKNENSG